MRSSVPLTSNTRLGPYEIVGPLGAGGMGEVYGSIAPTRKRTSGSRDSARRSDDLEKELMNPVGNIRGPCPSSARCNRDP